MPVVEDLRNSSPIKKQEVCEILRISRGTLRRMEKDGRFPSHIRVLLGRRVRYNPTALLEWINAGCPVPGGAIPVVSDADQSPPCSLRGVP
jgi:excisionase family DNA binding protein